MFYTKELCQRIRDLRMSGHSIPEISNILQIPKTTVLRKVKGVEILPQYYQRWLDRKKTAQMLLKKNLDSAKKEAEERIQFVTDKEAAIIISMLYWAEGSKKDFTFCNTDPEMIRTFIICLYRTFKIKPEDLKISLRIYEDLNRNDCLKYWSKVTGIGLNNNTTVNVLVGSKKGKLQYGMCRIRVKNSGLIHKKVFAIINRVNRLLSAPIV